jgi:Protein of unknown function (DUF2804)
MPTLPSLPIRDRPTGLRVPPARMRLWTAGRPLKRWRYVGLYGDSMMLCAADVRIAGLPQGFWALWDREARSEDGGGAAAAGGELTEKTVFRPGAVRLGDDEVRFGPAVLTLETAGEAMEVTSRHGESYIWTRKQPVLARGRVAGREVELYGLIDDSAGYHARRTDWRWCAGVGVGPSGEQLCFNIVDGVHDAPEQSERTVWVDGVASELPPATFADDLSAVTFPADPTARLAFAEEARRARSDDFKIMASDYVQPFGTFSGTLPGGVAVARGWGVMERHSVRW